MSNPSFYLDRQHGETEQAFEGFSYFRDLGLGRTVAAVGRKLGKSGNLVDRWCQAHRWRDRAAAYDAAQIRARETATAERRRVLIERHLQGATDLFDLAMRGMHPAPLLDRDGRAVSDEQGRPIYRPLSLRELAGAATALDKAIQQQRLAAGLPSDVRQHDVAMRQTFEEMNTMMEEVLAIIEEFVCDDCRDKIADRMDEIGQQRARIEQGVL
ncbi:MAG TPA: hypothetical protein VIL85_24925 [Thermomicrobiales bacterium]|jgi:hypothetical protein